MRAKTLILALAAVLVPAAAAAQDTRAAIVDAAWDTRPYLAELAANGVQVVGRYYARCPQPERGLPSKRLIDQGDARDRGSEVARIEAAGMAILSIYQFNNDSKNKFFGRDRNGKVLPDGDCRPTGRPRSPAEEGRLDASAAVSQARAVGQPRGTAIYFGVDIAFSKADTATRGALLEYLTEVRRVLGRAGYDLGAYGNGDALEVLREEGLIGHAWLSAARAYPGTTRVHNSGRWDMFQHGVNLEWFTGAPGRCRRGLPLDVNIVNVGSAEKDLGFWTSRGSARVAPARTRAVWAAHRFACDGDTRIRVGAAAGPRELISSTARCQGGKAVRHPATADYANAVRVGERSGDLVAVDHDHDGSFDGWTAAANLTGDFGAKPEWIGSRAARAAAHCR